MDTPTAPSGLRQYDLVTWLRAQLADSEARSRKLLYWAQQHHLAVQDPKLLGKYIPGWHDWPDVETLCQLHLSEVDAKRRILDLHAPTALRRVVGGTGTAQDVVACGYDTDPDGAGWVGYPCETLRILALPYADRPGYRDEWRPE